MVRAAATLGCLLWLGCSGGSGASPDAAAPDAGAVDASAGPDAAHADAATPDAGPDAGPHVKLGVAYSPKGNWASPVAQDLLDFYNGHAAYGELIAYHDNWRSPGTQSGLPALATQAPALGRQFGFTPVVGIGWADGAGRADLTSTAEPANNSWTNVASRQAYLTEVSDFARAEHPPYLFLGNETNEYYLTHSAAEWAAWVSEYRACYDAIKAVSPATIVYTTFQLEHMKGLGRKNGWTQPAQWSLLADFAGKLDAVGFTSYPYFEYETPAEIPASYYDDIRAHYSGRVIFSEIGWLADPTAPYTGSEAEQVAFLGVFFARTAGLDVDYVLWPFLHDPPGLGAGSPFSQIGLRANDGTARLVDSTWRAQVTAHRP